MIGRSFILISHSVLIPCLLMDFSAASKQTLSVPCFSEQAISARDAAAFPAAPHAGILHEAATELVEIGPGPRAEFVRVFLNDVEKDQQLALLFPAISQVQADESGAVSFVKEKVIPYSRSSLWKRLTSEKMVRDRFQDGLTRIVHGIEQIPATLYRAGEKGYVPPGLEDRMAERPGAGFLKQIGPTRGQRSVFVYPERMKEAPVHLPEALEQMAQGAMRDVDFFMHRRDISDVARTIIIEKFQEAWSRFDVHVSVPERKRKPSQGELALKAERQPKASKGAIREKKGAWSKSNEVIDAMKNNPEMHARALIDLAVKQWLAHDVEQANANFALALNDIGDLEAGRRIALLVYVAELRTGLGQEEEARPLWQAAREAIASVDRDEQMAFRRALAQHLDLAGITHDAILLWKEILYTSHDIVRQIEAAAALGRLDSPSYWEKADDLMKSLRSHKEPDYFWKGLLRALTLYARECQLAGDSSKAQALFKEAVEKADLLPVSSANKTIPLRTPYLFLIADQQIDLGLLGDAEKTLTGADEKRAQSRFMEIGRLRAAAGELDAAIKIYDGPSLRDDPFARSVLAADIGLAWYQQNNVEEASAFWTYSVEAVQSDIRQDPAKRAEALAYLASQVGQCEMTEWTKEILTRVLKRAVQLVHGISRYDKEGKAEGLKALAKAQISLGRLADARKTIKNIKLPAISNEVRLLLLDAEANQDSRRWEREQAVAKKPKRKRKETEETPIVLTVAPATIAPAPQQRPLDWKLQYYISVKDAKGRRHRSKAPTPGQEELLLQQSS